MCVGEKTCKLLFIRRLDSRHRRVQGKNCLSREILVYVYRFSAFRRSARSLDWRVVFFREICKNGLIKLYDTSFTEEKMLDSSIGIDEIIAWFQNKVADYDLQIWERSVMRKELLEKLTVEGSRKSPVPEHLIDLDLVQGNSFPKAKPINDGAPWRPWCQGVSCAVFMLRVFEVFANTIELLIVEVKVRLYFFLVLEIFNEHWSPLWAVLLCF